jgi:hypothetical protein
MRVQQIGAQIDPMNDRAQPPRYEIRVRGRLGETLLSAFPTLQVDACDGDTVLPGALPDRAPPHACLQTSRRLSLELLEVHRDEM